MLVKQDKKKLGVDAGNIGAIAAEKAECPCSPLFSMTFDMGKPGKYSVNIKIYGTWNGHRAKTRVIETTTGRIYVGDLCYFFEDGWDAFLNETQYLKLDTPYAFSVDTGGDGCFNTYVTVKEVIKNAKRQSRAA